MTFKRSKGRRLKFDQSVLDKFAEVKQTDPLAPEAGGILLGRLIEGSKDVIIDEATMPTKEDWWGRLFFRRAKRHAQEKVIAAWKSSDHTKIYFGEWHTHPEGNPQPSSQDVQNWLSILSNATYEQDFLIFVIVGIKDIKVWELRKKTKNPLELLPC